MSSKVYPSVDESVTSLGTQYEWTGAACAASGSHNVISTSTFYVSRKIRTATGQDTPGWRKMRNAGVLLPMTPWTRWKYDGQASLATRQFCTPTRLRHWTDAYISNPDMAALGNVSPNWFLEKTGTLPDFEYYIQKSASAIYSSGWDALTFLAEIGQLRRMLSGVARKLDNLSNGRRPDELVNLWLEGRYGWRTLMYDIRDLHEVLSQANERRSRYSQRTGQTTGGSYNGSVDSTANNIVVNDSYTLTWVISTRGSVIADVDIPDFQFNPVTTLWEVTRLSFVVDWLLNVGQALEAASFLLRVKDYRAAGGYKIDYNLNGIRTYVSSTVVTNPVITGSWSSSATYWSRVPSSVSVFPHLKLRLDEFKVIDLLALIAQRLR